MKRFILIAAAAIACAAASAQTPKFAHVNFNELIQLMPEMDAARVQSDAAQKEASETYQAMIAAYDEDPENINKYAEAYKTAYTRMGSYYMGLEDKDKAREYFQKVLEIDPDYAPVKKVLSEL